jgi:hypothetical protein
MHFRSNSGSFLQRSFLFLFLFLRTDIALNILDLDPKLATVIDTTTDTACGWRALEVLAKEPSAISSKSQLSSWKSGLNSC